MTIQKEINTRILKQENKTMKTNEAMKTIFTLFLMMTSFLVFGQTTINGKVVSENGEPLPGVNIFLEGTYDGASSDSEGIFTFTTTEEGVKTLLASFIGYKTWKQEVNLSSNTELAITLKESVNTLDAVTITAGSFEAADESRASVMKPLDVYTTPYSAERCRCR